MSAIEYRNRGRDNCKGNARADQKPDGSIVVTCARCGLDYTIPPPESLR